MKEKDYTTQNKIKAKNIQRELQGNRDKSGNRRKLKDIMFNNIEHKSEIRYCISKARTRLCNRKREDK